jgi:hypothetical protein
MVLVQGAQHILGPFGEDSDLRRWGLKLAERGGKSGKKRAIITVARKLAVLLHHLWISCEEYGRHHNPLAQGQREYQNRSLSCMGACTPITSMMSTPPMPTRCIASKSAVMPLEVTLALFQNQ